MLRGGEEFVKTNCCELISTGSHRAVSGMRAVTGGPHPAFARRYLPLAGWVSSGWIVPGGILLLLPKCPACIVAYLAIAGGIGICDHRRNLSSDGDSNVVRSLAGIFCG